MYYCYACGGRRGHDRVVVGFTTTYATVSITTNVVRSNLDQGEVCNIMGCSLSVWFPPPIKLTATI
jgi:hypothetical protein